MIGCWRGIALDMELIIVVVYDQLHYATPFEHKNEDMSLEGTSVILNGPGLTQWGLTIELHSFVHAPVWYSWQQRFWTFNSRAYIPLRVEFRLGTLSILLYISMDYYYFSLTKFFKILLATKRENVHLYTWAMCISLCMFCSSNCSNYKCIVCFCTSRYENL